jgi:hypothetical protein
MVSDSMVLVARTGLTPVIISLSSSENLKAVALIRNEGSSDKL